MHGIFAGLTTLDVAQLVAEAVPENQKVTSQQQMIAAGGPATNAAVTFSTLSVLANRLHPSRQWPHALLLSALGRGAATQILREDLTERQVEVVDCTAADQLETADGYPSVSAILISAATGSRTLASTNSRLPLHTQVAQQALAQLEQPSVVLIDGHNPELGKVAIEYFNTDEDDNPFSAQENPPRHLRILDGGSWKPWLPPLLANLDVAVISADFIAPGAHNFADTVEFLRGFGVRRVVQTRGHLPTRWAWLDDCGEAEVSPTTVKCTLAAGDVFHGAFAWAAAIGTLTRDSADPRAAVNFANQVARLSTTHFGTRTWLAQEEKLVDALENLLSVTPDKAWKTPDTRANATVSLG